MKEVLAKFDWDTNEIQTAVLQIMSFYGCFEEIGFPNKFLTEEQISTLKERDYSEDELNAAMQSKLKRQEGSERAMLTDDTRLEDDDLKDKLRTYYNQLNMLSRLPPISGKKYDAILLLGCAQGTFESRLKTLITAVTEGGIRGAIYTLGSDRALWPFHEPITSKFLTKTTGMPEEEIIDIFYATFRRQFPDFAHLQNEALLKAVQDSGRFNDINAARRNIVKAFTDLGHTYPTEADMMAAILKESTLSDSISLKAMTKADGKRPTTEDTVIAFRDGYGGTPERILVVSKQPEALYQIEPTKKILKGANIDVIADEAPSGIKFSIINDAIARKVYSRLEQYRQEEIAAKASAEEGVEIQHSFARECRDNRSSAVKSL